MPGEIDNSTILQAVNQLIKAVNDLTLKTEECCSKSGGGGCGGCGGGTGGVTDTPPATGQPEGAGSGPGGYPPPEDWDGTTEAYSTYKCQAANYVYDAIYNGLIRIGGLSTILSGVTSAAVAGQLILSYFVSTGAAFTAAGGVVFFAFTPAWVLGLVAASIAGVVVLVGLGVILIFAQVAEEMDARHEDLVCSLYNAQDVQSAQSGFSDIMGEVLNEAIIGLPPELSDYGGAFSDMFAYILPYILPNTLFNKLFEDAIEVKMYEAEGIDCSACEQLNYTVITGTQVSGPNANPFQVELVTRATDCSNGRQAVINFSQPFKLTDISSLAGFANCGGLSKIYLYASEGATGDSISVTNTLPDPENYIGARSMALIVSDVSFPVITITFEWEE